MKKFKKIVASLMVAVDNRHCPLRLDLVLKFN